MDAFAVDASSASALAADATADNDSSVASAADFARLRKAQLVASQHGDIQESRGTGGHRVYTIRHILQEADRI